MKNYLSAFVVGFGVGVIQVVPVAKSFACCLFMPVAAYLAILLDRKSKGESGEVEFKQAAIIGVLTGIWAALFGTFFDVFITFVTHSNDVVATFGELRKALESLPVDETVKKQAGEMLSAVVVDITEKGFSMLYTVSALINNLVVDTLFGFIGGVVGMNVINSRLHEN